MDDPLQTTRELREAFIAMGMDDSEATEAAIGRSVSTYHPSRRRIRERLTRDFPDALADFAEAQGGTPSLLREG